jgi:hypothetical protein
MARYVFMQPAFIDGRLYESGEHATLRDDWIPGPYVDPIDGAAIKAFWEAGVQLAPLQQQRWTFSPITRHARIFWRQIGNPHHKLFVLNNAEHLGPKHQHNRGSLP